MFWLIGVVATSALAIFAYATARNFVTRRLRYVDAVQSTIAPIIAGAAVALVASPVVMFLPFVGIGTALTLGLAVGFGVASGARDVRKKLPGY